MAGYLPANDSQFWAWMTNFMGVLETHLAELGLTAADIVELQNANIAFGSNLAAHVTKRAESKAATTAKDESRGATELYLRQIVNEINNKRSMTNELREALGLPSRGGSRTIVTAASIPETPGIYLEAEQGKVIIHFGTSPVNEMMNGKPVGVKGCNVYRKKAGEEAFSMIAFSSASPYVDVITGPAADYTYFVQYRGAKTSDLGGQSAEETIAARGAVAA